MNQSENLKAFHTFMADTFFRLATESKIDPSIGFILQIPEIMQADNDAFQQIRSFCADNGIEITPSFFHDLARLVAQNGINPITPMAYVVAKKKARALEIYNETKRTSWGPHIPFFFQTNPDAAFYVYRTSTDALHAMVKILADRQVIYTKPTDGSKTPLRVDWILEHVVGNNPCYALFDLDDYSHRYQGRISEQEIEAHITGFSSRFTTLLIETGCINDDEETVIEVKVKDRSRWIEEKNSRKLSYHKIFSVFGSKTAHKLAVAACLRQPFNSETTIEQWLKDTVKNAVKSAGDYSAIPDKLLATKHSLVSLISLDPAALPGGANGITTFGSVKKRSDPPPVHGPTTTYCLGLPITVQECPYPTPHGFNSEHLSLQDKLQMLCSMSYTIPKHAMTFYTDGLLDKARGIISMGLAETTEDAKVFVTIPFIEKFRPSRGVEPRPAQAGVNPDAEANRWGVTASSSSRHLLRPPRRFRPPSPPPDASCQNGSSQR